jgi:hypothetical protein
VRDEAFQLSCNSYKVEQTKRLFFVFLLTPVIFMALFMAGTFWFFVYPSSIALPGMVELLDFVYFPSRCILIAIIFIAPLFILLALLRSLYEKPLSNVSKTIWAVVFFSIWMSIFVREFKHVLAILLNWLYENTEPISVICILLFFVSIIKASLKVLGYEKSKHSVKIDIISCITLCIVYISICNYFIREGGIIYVVPFREKNTVTEDFPNDKKNILKSFLKFAELNNHNAESFFHPEKQIRYKDLLAAAAISPALLERPIFRINYPRFYVRYLTNEILFPLSEDLAQKEYWGRKLIVSSERINNHFYQRVFEMERDIALASKYLSILRAMARGKPDAAYLQMVNDKSSNRRFGDAFHLGHIIQMTPEEEKEWLYWYKILWPQLEHIIDPK